MDGFVVVVVDVHSHDLLFVRVQLEFEDGNSSNREKKRISREEKTNQRGCARPDSSSMSSTMMISFSIEMDANHMHRLSNKEIERQSEQ